MVVKWLVESGHDREVLGLNLAISKLFLSELVNLKLLGVTKLIERKKMQETEALALLPGA